MDALPSPAGDLNELERRLSTLQPSTAGLDAGRMLFAAGRDSVRQGWGRVAWPIISGCLALLAAVLGVGFALERTARLELALRIHHQTIAPVPVPAIPDGGETPSAEPPAADSYLAARQALLQNLDAWPVLDKVGPSPGPPPPSVPIWNARSRTDVIDP
jgi:hypothetical protein